MEEVLASKQTVSLKRLGGKHSEEMAYGRFLRNEKVDEQGLTKGITNRTVGVVEGKHVLSIQDTSELHYHRHRHRIKDPRGLGEAGRSPLGYFMHPSIVVGSGDGMVYGLSDIHLFHREWHRGTDSSSRKYRPIESKESYKWIGSSQRSKEVLHLASTVTIVQDRDGDIYETFAIVPDARTHLLIRSKTDRKTEEGGLYELVGSQAPAVVYELEVDGENKKRRKRRAHMEIRYCRARIKRPANLPATYPRHIEITVVEAKEVAATVPPGEEPIEWKLLTTHEIEDFMGAVQVVFWYTLRWLIEELFRLLKRKGFDLESSELETGPGLRKLGILCMQAAIRAMQLRQAREAGCQLPVRVVFDEQEQQCLEELLPVLEGKTAKQKNPHPPNMLSWASWVIGRLGGWSGYASQRPPGVITMKRGLERFEVFYWGWKIAKNTKPVIDSS